MVSTPCGKKAPEELVVWTIWTRPRPRSGVRTSSIDSFGRGSGGGGSGRRGGKLEVCTCGLCSVLWFYTWGRRLSACGWCVCSASCLYWHRKRIRNVARGRNPKSRARKSYIVFPWCLLLACICACILQSLKYCMSKGK